MIREMSLLGGKDRTLPSMDQTYVRVCLCVNIFVRARFIRIDREQSRNLIVCNKEGGRTRCMVDAN